MRAEELLKLGLRFDPFAGHSAFFSRPALVQRIDMLHHLIQYSELLLVVVGERGAGKSTLLDELTARAGENWQVSRVASEGRLTDKALVDRIITGFGETVGAPSSLAALRLLERHLEALRGKGKVALVAIDDAQALAPEVLKPVLQWATQREPTRPRILVQCESAYLPKLLSALRSLGKEDLAHPVEVPPLTEAQTDEYLQMRLERAGWSGASPFRIGVVQSIHKASGGIPGRVNELAQKVLRNLVLGKSGSAGLASLPKLRLNLGNSNLRPFAYGALGFGLTLVLALVWNSTRHSDPTGESPEQLAGERLTDPTRPSVGLARVDVNESEPTRALVSPSGAESAIIGSAPAYPHSGDALEPAADPVASEHRQASATRSDAPDLVQPEPVVAKQDATAVTAGERATRLEPWAAPSTGALQTLGPAATTMSTLEDAAVLAGGQDTTLKRVPTTPARLPQLQPEGEVAAASSAGRLVADGTLASLSAATVDDKSARDIDWLRRQAPDHYTIQLIGTHSREAMEAFIERHGLGSQAAWFKTSHRDKDWYVVVYGIYADRKLALTELKTLPAGLRRAQPWARRVASVLAADQAQP
jgi:DamX protein